MPGARNRVELIIESIRVLAAKLESLACLRGRSIFLILRHDFEPGERTIRTTQMTGKVLA